MKSIIASLLSVFLACFASATFAETRTVYKDGVVTVYSAQGGAKSTAKLSSYVSGTCYSTAIVSSEVTVDVPTTGTKTVIFATAARCATSRNMGVSFYGAYELIEYVGSVNGLAYYKATPVVGEPVVQPTLNTPMIHEEVYVIDETPIKLTSENETMIVWANRDSKLPGKIVQERDYGDRELPASCNPSGCMTSSEQVVATFKVIQGTLDVPPGSAVLNARNQTVGILLGPDSWNTNRTLMIDVNSVVNGLYTLGILVGGGKG